MPAGAMQAEINRICEDMCTKVSDDDVGSVVYALPMFLKSILTQDQVQATLKYIKSRQDEHTDGVPRNYSTLLLAQLKQIRSAAQTASDTQIRIPCTGDIKASHCMCLYVCGFLKPLGKTFLQLTNGTDHERAYADAFFDAIFADEQMKITVTESYQQPESELSKFELLDATLVSGKNFICARPRAAEHMSHENILVLDAFADENQFLEYDHAVWHLYCLWTFAYTQQKLLCSYGVKTGTKSFVFLGCYKEHSEYQVSSYSDGDDQTKFVKALVQRPLAMYASTCAALGVADDATVISRSWQDDPPVYIPLAYVHLLVRPSATHYADVAYNVLLQDILQFAVGQTQQYILQELKFQKQAPYIDNPAPANLAGIVLLCQEHYDLMLAHKFAIPADATQQQILFDDIKPGEQSQHLDHIAALCDVRYNWVFAPSHKAAWHMLPLQKNATYHAIDVQRHITHLQAEHGAKSDFLKTLSTGFHVTDSTGRKGVIIFDVQAHGRALGLFDSQRKPTAVGLERAAVLQLFAKAKTKTSDNNRENRTLLYNALNGYFNDRPKWCLCDMAYKYAVLQDDNTIFIQDSLALTPDATPPSCARCLFCPACFCEPSDALPDMHTHITSAHPDYYISDVVPSASSAGSSYDPSIAGSGSAAGVSSISDFDPSASNSSASGNSEEDLKERAANLRTEVKLEELKTKSDKPSNADDAQAHLSESNYAALQQKYKELEELLDKHTREQQRIIDDLKEDIRLLNEQLRQHETDATLNEDAKKALEEELRIANDKNTEAVKELEDAKKSITQDTQQIQDDHKKTLEEKQKEMDAQNAQLKQLEEEIEKTTQAAKTHNEELENLKRQLKEKDDEIARLTAANAALLLEIEALKQRITDLEAELEASKRRTTDASTEDHVQMQKLQDELAQAKKDLTEAQAKVDAAAAETHHLQADLTNLQAKTAQKDALLAQLKAHLDAERAGIDDALRAKRESLRQIQDTISANVQTQIALAELAEKLEAEQYTAIRDAVLNGIKNPRQTRKTDAALFLILESMGGTWCMYLKLVRGKKPFPKTATTFNPTYDTDMKKYTDTRDLILRQMIYDLTMWFSISNTPKLTRYMSHHVQLFIDAFALENTEPTGDADSSDDDAPPQGPPAAGAGPNNNNPPRRTTPAFNKPSSPLPGTARTRAPSPAPGAGPNSKNGRKPVRGPGDTKQKSEDEKKADADLDAAFTALQRQDSVSSKLVRGDEVLPTPRNQPADYGDQTPRPGDTIQPVATVAQV